MIRTSLPPLNKGGREGGWGRTLATYNDHRLAMSLALAGLRIPGIRIENPGCVAKTYPTFWQDLEKMRQ
jgi:3-phosphoshikimate 1-carboxyvinyltransferase